MFAEYPNSAPIITGFLKCDMHMACIDCLFLLGNMHGEKEEVLLILYITHIHPGTMNNKQSLEFSRSLIQGPSWALHSFVYCVISRQIAFRN